MARVAAALALLTVAALAVRAQSPQPISGRVVSDETGAAIPNARVSLTTTAPAAPVVLTDRDGVFTITRPGPGYTIVASKTGYARRDVLPAANDQTIVIRLIRNAVISGRVVDEFGDPIVGAPVMVQPPTGSPQRQLEGVTTDDLGEYRLSGLTAGSYVVSVTTTNAATLPTRMGNALEYSPSQLKRYFPGVASQSDAEVVRVDSGDERTGVDFVVPGGQIGGPSFQSVATIVERGSPSVNAVLPRGAILGRVTSTDGRPLAHALVRLFSTTAPFPIQTTRADNAGSFALENLARGRYRVAAAKTGYSSRGTDLETPIFADLATGTVVDLGRDEIKDRVELTLERLGKVTGRVVDEFGDAILGASVQLLKLEYRAGRKHLVPAGSVHLTDDMGRYRLWNIAPGHYVVSAAVGSVSTVDVPGYGRTYYPGTADPGEAALVIVDAAQEVQGIDVALVRTPTARVAGTILNAAGEPSSGGSVALRPATRAGLATSIPFGARIFPGGRFEFPNVPAGPYVIEVDRGRRNPSTEGEFGVLPVTVGGGDVTDLVVHTSAGSSITGRVVFDHASSTPLPPRSGIILSTIVVDPDRSPSTLASANIHDDWTFEMSGINGPRRLTVAPRADWMLEEIRVDGVDVTDRAMVFGRKEQSISAVDVVLTDRVTELSGSVADARSNPLPRANVIAFSTDRADRYPSSRFVRRAVADANAFSITALPPGNYSVVAIASVPDDAGPDAWEEPAFLESLSAAARTVTIEFGRKETIALRALR